METTTRMTKDEALEIMKNVDSNMSKERLKFQRLTKALKEVEEICDEMDWMYLCALGKIELPIDENEALLTKARIFNKITGSKSDFENLPVDVQEMIYEIVMDIDIRSYSPEEIE